jgi:hypothetical protein
MILLRLKNLCSRLDLTDLQHSLNLDVIARTQDFFCDVASPHIGARVPKLNHHICGMLLFEVATTLRVGTEATHSLTLGSDEMQEHLAGGFQESSCANEQLRHSSSTSV